MNRRVVLKGAAAAAGITALGGLGQIPIAAAADPPPGRLGAVGHGYPSTVETGKGFVAFGIGPQKRMYHRWQETGGGSGWVELYSHELGTRPVGLVNPSGALSVFAIAPDGTMINGWQPTPGNPIWQWANLGGDLNKGGEPFPVLNVNNAVTVFALGRTGVITHNWQDFPGAGFKATWTDFPGGTVGRPYAVVGPSGGVVVFAKGAAGGIVHRWQRFHGDQFQPLTEWAQLCPDKGPAIGDPAAVLTPTGAIAVFAESARGVTLNWQLGAGGLWRNGWDEWTDIRILGRPAVVVGPSGGTALFAKMRDGTNNLVHTAQSAYGTGWSPWRDLATTVTGEPSALAHPDGTLSAFGRTADGLMLRVRQRAPESLDWIQELFAGELGVG